MKVLTRYGARAVIEASYAAGGAPATTDGLLPVDNLDPTLEYLFDGTRGASPLGGQFARAAQSGLGVTLDFATHCYTPGSAYSATVRPSVDKLLRAAGFTVTTILTSGLESHTYAPTNLVSQLESLFLQIFRAGQQFDMKGVYSTLSIAVDGPGIPVWTFGLKGIGARPVDAVVPTDTVYPHLATQKPANAINVALALGAFTGGVVRSFSFDLNRELTPRANDNSASGHQGFAPGNWGPRFTVTVEAEALGAIGATTLDPYQLMEDGTELAFSTRFGVAGTPGQYKRWTLGMPKAQIVGVADAADGPLATWELEIAGAVTPGAAPNDLTFLFD